MRLEGRGKQRRVGCIVLLWWWDVPRVGIEEKVERSMMGLKGREVVRNEDLHRIWHEAR